MRLSFVALSCACLGACACASSDITPAYVSPVMYQPYTCAQLAQEAQAVSARAATLSGAQDQKRTNDAIATTAAVVIFWPAAFFVGGDRETAAELAKMKGQMVAIEQASIQKNAASKSGERTENFRGDKVHPALLEVQRKFARAAIDHGPKLQEADPDMGSLFNRDADNWRPLFAIADLAGGKWPERIRQCALKDISDGLEEETDEKLLNDIRWIFDGGPTPVDDGVELKFEVSDRVISADMCTRLAEIEGRPWGEWGKSGKAITQMALSTRLKEFKIKTRNTRVNRRVLKAFHREDFKDIFERYLAPPFRAATPLQPSNHNDFCDFNAATRQNDVAATKSHKSLKKDDCSGVAGQDPPRDDVDDFLKGEGWPT
jgi:hypothetical protein